MAQMNELPKRCFNGSELWSSARVAVITAIGSLISALLSAVVSASGALDASPSGGGSTAVMAVLDAMGLLADGQAFVHESMNGSLLTGRVAGRARAGESAALLVEIEGRAWATGEQTWFLDHDDPFRDGIRASS